MRILPCGDRAVLLDCATLAEATGWSTALADLEPVLGARTVLLRGNPSELRSVVASRQPAREVASGNTGEIAIAVRYDGPDLGEVAALTGMSEKDVVAAHTGTPWIVAFSGFAPGFAYLTGGDRRLHVPRRSSPRPSVPAGAVGLAGEFSGIYPRSSPGGWQVIGRTPMELFDVHHDPPALLRPGMRVRFEALP